MNTHYTDAPEAIAIVQRAFPSYRHSAGKLQVKPFVGPVNPTSYWSGGSRDYWAFASLDGEHASGSIRENGSGFTEPVLQINELPAGVALVRLSDGHYKSATLYVPETNLALMLPAPMELSRDQKAVLVATRTLKSAYRKEYLGRVGITAERIEQVQAELMSFGLLAKNKSVTTDGRNAVPELGSFYQIEDMCRG